ncbi:5'-AMP-activated protein kinase beta subunit, interation domain-domain-containing protein, partial [Clohesyomyces aquaticus]
AASDTAMGNEQSRQKDRERADRGSGPASVPTQPVAIAALHGVDSHGGSRSSEQAIASSVDPADASVQDYFIAPSQYSRPPRLPLPIEEEPHTPGSPIISPQDIVSPINSDDVDGDLPRKTSVLSSEPAEDEELADEFKNPGDLPTVPTLIEWEGPGERVYVTGTFANWNRKYRLHRNGPSPKKDVLSAMVNFPAGTHHLKFIVDGDMKTSDKLPTAVDYTNILVNYLEISLDDIPQPLAVTPEEAKKADAIPPPEPAPPKPKVPAQVASPKKYHSNIPRYLLDLDAPDNSSRLARANAVANNLPTPPSLPMFLSKSILNGTTPMKDDSSVLIMPNHTVLNHLATSSIKDNILATSATTRYKQKFLTTIMYKP